MNTGTATLLLGLIDLMREILQRQQENEPTQEQLDADEAAVDAIVAEWKSARKNP
jgi:hypothetical protein